jgi:hypothetical protein
MESRSGDGAAWAKRKVRKHVIPASDSANSDSILRWRKAIRRLNANMVFKNFGDYRKNCGELND